MNAFLERRSVVPVAGVSNVALELSMLAYEVEPAAKEIAGRVNCTLFDGTSVAVFSGNHNYA